MKDLFPIYSIGHFINKPNHPTEFEITRFEEMEELDIEDPHKHTFYEILWFDEGFSTQIIDYKSYSITPRSLFFISPYQVHHFEAWHNLKGGSIFFTKDFFLLQQPNKEKLFEITFLDNFFSDALWQPSDETYKDIRATIEWMFQEKARKDASLEIIQSLLNILLTQIQRGLNQERAYKFSKHYVGVYKKLIQLIDQHYTEALTAKDYANMMHFTPHYLNLVAKTVAGKTTTELIRARTMLEAKRLLTFSNYTISEIATYLNYFDVSYFGKLFKAETNLSPLEFKKAMSQKYQNPKVSF